MNGVEIEIKVFLEESNDTAISFVVVTTLLENMPCLAFDEDFRGLRLTMIA